MEVLININELKKIAFAFRKDLEESKNDRKFNSLRFVDFLRGLCGKTSDLIV